VTADIEEPGAHWDHYRVGLQDAVFVHIQVEGRAVDQEPIELFVPQDLDIAADVLDLDQPWVARLAPQLPPLSQVTLIAVEIEQGDARALPTRGPRVKSCKCYYNFRLWRRRSSRFSWRPPLSDATADNGYPGAGPIAVI